MRRTFQCFVTIGLVALPVCAASADIITYNMTEVTSQTLRSLGNSFVLGCAALAAGIVIAAVISKKK